MTNWNVLQSVLLPCFPEPIGHPEWDGEPKLFKAAAPSSLLPISDLEAVWEFHKFQPSDLQLIAADKPPVPHARFIRPDGLVDLSAFRKLYQSGYTIVLNRAQNFFASVRKLTTDLFDVRQENVSVNIYMTPENSVGFPAHFDPHAVFAVQLLGRKTWTLFDREQRRATPRSHHAFDPVGKPTVAEFELNAGDILFVPRGFPHSCKSLLADSVHLSVHFEEYTISDLIRGLTDHCESTDARFRELLNRSVPPESLIRNLQSCLQLMLEPEQLTAGLKSIESKIDRTKHLEGTPPRTAPPFFSKEH